MCLEIIKKTTLIMSTATCRIHNVRFYNLEPREVLCLSYERIRKKLALARKDNSVEIWNTANAPFLESTIVPQSDDNIEALAWINDERLLSTGFSGMITEYDLSMLTPKYEVAVTGGVVWCIDINNAKTRLAAGTEEGYINTFSITDDSLIYERIFDKQKGRILCIQWDNTGDMIFTGSSDTVRVWNAISGHAVHRMTTSRKRIKHETIVWCLGVTNDNHIVSGDSRGVLSIWDPNIGTLVESHESHAADIQSLVVSRDTNVIYCAGVDPVIRSFSKVIKAPSTSAGGKITPSWVKGIERRLHSHDVRGLAEDDGKLYSSGVDSYLALSSYPPKILTKYPPLLEPSCVTVCKKSRCILLRYVNYLELWKLGKATRDTVSPGMVHSLETEPVKLLELRAKGGKTIVSCAVNEDSSIIVYATDNDMRVFNFDIIDGDAQLTKKHMDISINRIRKLLFSPNGKLLVVVSHNQDGNKISVFMVENKCLNYAGEFHTAKHKIINLRLLCFSPDSKYLICTDRNSTIVAYTVNDAFTSGSPSCWPLPKYNCPPTAMAVQKDTSNLVIVYSDHKVIEYNLPAKMYTDFSNNLQKRIPSHWLARPYPITNITFDPTNENVIILHDDTTVYVIRKDKEVQNEKNAKIRRHMNGEDDSSSGSSFQGQHVFKVIKKYKHLVHLEWFDDNEMVAVEVNPISLAQKLPLTLKQKCFAM